jgi:hypothetical protein
MALHSILKINGYPIGSVYAQRREALDLQDPATVDAVSTYDARVLYADDREAPWEGTVRHRYGDGAWELVRAVLNARAERT